MKNIVLFFLLLISLNLMAHPTGSMLENNTILAWTYVCPIDSSNHKACIMLKKTNGSISPWLVSEFNGSNWTMSSSEDDYVYLVESYHDHAKNLQRTKLIKARLAEEPEVLWDWFDDPYQFGQQGFIRYKNNSFLFVKYPHIYIINEKRQVSIWRKWNKPVSKIKYVSKNKLLVLNDDEVKLISFSGELLKSWNSLSEETSQELPFMGNKIFDVDYKDDELVLAYWGKYRCDKINNDGKRSTLKVFEAPYVPHWVFLNEKGTYCFASSINPGEAIQPELWLIDEKDSVLIWKGGYSSNHSSHQTTH